MDVCHVKHSELAKHLHAYKGRVVPWKDHVKDFGGYRAVLTGQGASASKVGAAISLDTTSGQRCSISFYLGASVRRLQIITIARGRECVQVFFFVLAGGRSDTRFCSQLLLHSDCTMSWSWSTSHLTSRDGLWRSGYSDWTNISLRPNQQRLWMCTMCGHCNSSKAACSQCGLRRSWAEVVKGVQQTNSTTPPSQPKEEIKALEAALAALPDNVDIFG